MHTSLNLYTKSPWDMQSVSKLVFTFKIGFGKQFPKPFFFDFCVSIFEG